MPGVKRETARVQRGGVGHPISASGARDSSTAEQRPDRARGGRDPGQTKCSEFLMTEIFSLGGDAERAIITRKGDLKNKR